MRPDNLNDDALGKALDTLYDFGVSELYRSIARRAAQRLGLGGGVVVGHLDTTSFHVDGRYNTVMRTTTTQKTNSMRGVGSSG